MNNRIQNFTFINYKLLSYPFQLYNPVFYDANTESSETLKTPNSLGKETSERCKSILKRVMIFFNLYNSFLLDFSFAILKNLGQILIPE